ncbi:TPA: hypothetical protein N0F65_002187, partial [Lagenidium giganteum]
RPLRALPSRSNEGTHRAPHWVDRGGSTASKRESEGSGRRKRRRATPDARTATRTAMSTSPEEERAAVLNAFKAKVREHREIESRVKSMRENVKALVKEYNKTEDDLKALQSVGQIIGEVLRQLDEDRFIVKASSGPRYVVGCRSKVDKTKLVSGTRVALDMTTLTIMRNLPREVDPTVYHMLHEDAGKGDIDYESIVKLTDGVNGADIRNVCTEAGVFAIRADREYVVEEDFMKAARKLAETKKLESKMDYSKAVVQTKQLHSFGAMAAIGSIVCELIGLLRDVHFHRCRLLLQELSVLHPQFLPRLHGVMEMEFLDFLATHKQQIPKEHRQRHHQTSQPVLLLNQKHYLADEDELIAFAVTKSQLSRQDILAAAAFGAHNHHEQEQDPDVVLQAKAEAAAKESLFRYRQVAGNKFVFLDFEVNGIVLPRVELELFHRTCPRTCDNFIAFCEGTVEDEDDGRKLLGYKGNDVHRIVRGGWIQAGDVTNNGQGDGASRCLYGRHFADESFAISHDSIGVLSMANTGPHTNGSQFFITLAPQQWLDRKKGMHTIQTIGSLETRYERPLVPCRIVDCGRVE